MYVNRSLGLGYLAHPRTASRALSEALMTQLRFQKTRGHHTGPPSVNIEGLDCFTVVRNHWDAVASWYFVAGMPKEKGRLNIQWIATWAMGHTQYIRPNTLWWFTKLVPQVHILRYETLDRDVNKFLTARGLKPIEIPKIGADTQRHGTHYDEVFGEKSREFVEWLFREEIKALGYSYHRK